MQAVIQINGRDALPVRTLPFVGRWQWMASPDGIAFACSQSPTKIKRLIVNSDKEESDVAVRNREFLPSFALGEDGTVRSMHPEEWSFCAVELQGLEKRLKSVERSEDENFDIWRRQAIEKLPAEAFVWLDDFRRWFADTCQPDCSEQEQDDSIAAEPTLQPLVPRELENVLSCGGWFRRPPDRAAAVSPYVSLTSVLEGWFDTPFDGLPGEQWHRVKTDFWPMPWDELSPSQRRSVATQWDYSHAPETEDERKQWWELFCMKDAVQREIREWETLKPQSITEKAEQFDRLRALRDQEQLLHVQLSGDSIVSPQEEQAQPPSEAAAVLQTVEQFISVGPEPVQSQKVPKRETQSDRIEQCLRECERRAKEQGVAFDRTRMPGIKREFLMLLHAYDPYLQSIKETSSLKTHLDRMANPCKWPNGARAADSAIDLYRKLFPEAKICEPRVTPIQR